MNSFSHSLQAKGTLSRRLVLTGLAASLCLAAANRVTAQATAAKGSPAGGIEIKSARNLPMPPSMAKVIQGTEETVTAELLKAADEPAPLPREFKAVQLEFQDAASCQKCDFGGNKLITRLDKYATIFVPQKFDVQTFKSWPGFVWAEVDTENIFPPPPRPTPVKEKSRAQPEKIVKGGIGNLTGKGVIVAVIDTGLDFHHPDFITTDAKGQPVSRLLYFWDLTSDAYANGVGKKSDYAYPNGASIGTIYDRDTLTADLRDGKQRIREWDTNSHGTVCAGVAVGNGNGVAAYKGVAPQADIIAVRVAEGNNENAPFVFGYMVTAICEWLDKVANERKQPLVVSCSFGKSVGLHDGQSIEEHHLSERFNLSKVGRAICIAAGNDGACPMHASVPIGPKESAPAIQWNITAPGYLQLYIQTDQDQDLGFEALEGTKIMEKVDDYIHPLRKQIVLSMVVEAGQGGFKMYSKAGNKYEADAYLNGGGAFNRLKGFTGEQQSFSKQIGSPGAALNILTVGSFDWQNEYQLFGATVTLNDNYGKPMTIGGISQYSNPGPLRYGNVVKPEIVAPGQWYAASAPRNVVPYLRESSGLYQQHNGTSAATPYTAGIIALMFEKKPKMTWGEARKLITESATSNNFTGKTPNPSWGYGKLDYAAVEKIMAAIK